MNSESKSFLCDLLAQCGPSGFEEKVQSTWVKRTKQFSDKIMRDVHGNAVGVLNPEANFRIMLAGHCDEIGFIVSHISEKGFIYVAPIGGIDASMLPGTQVVIQSEKGMVNGVIGKKAIHLTEPEERTTVLAIKKLWVDIGAKDRDDALKAVQIGDPVSFRPNYIELRNNIFSSKGCDDRIGAFVVSETLKILSKEKKKLKIGVYGASTVQEEVGLRGATTSAFAIDPQVAIAIDVGFASDTPGIEKQVVGEVFLGKGPVLHAGPANNRALVKLLRSVAEKKKIPFQFSSVPRVGGTDTGAIQVTRQGVATALISMANRYMHTTVEACSSDDLVNAAKLIAETILSITPKTNFIPE